MPIQLQEFLIEADAKEQSVKCSLFAQVISRCGSATLKAWGTSMIPSIFPGDILTVHRAEASRLEAGDVAVYLHSGRLFVHRVVRAIDQNSAILVTRGDAMECDDPPVEAEEVVGRVTFIVPGRRLTYRLRRGLAALRSAMTIVFLLVS